MIFNEFKELNLSSLGFGTMRLPTMKEDPSKIDEMLTFEMFDYALANGVNYFDTAWGYHNGQSELIVGKALRRHPRDTFYLASKFPGYDVNNFGKIEAIFEEQLKKCQVDYFDFYLIHNVCEKNIDCYLDHSYKTLEYLLEQKKNGRIKHLGFSTHADYDNFIKFMNDYGDYMEFCQIQLNYIDYEFQDAKKKVEYLNSKNIPIWVMEPLRGGKLSTVSHATISYLTDKTNENTCSLAFRFLQSIKGVTVILSGMSSFEQVKDNIVTFNRFAPLNEEDFKKMLELGKSLTNSIPCTSCKYCTEYCPQGLNIPKLISLYNEQVYTGGGFIVPMNISALPENKRPSACIGCKSCESVCPQSIEISNIMSRFTDLLTKKS